MNCGKCKTEVTELFGSGDCIDCELKRVRAWQCDLRRTLQKIKKMENKRLKKRLHRMMGI